MHGAVHFRPSAELRSNDNHHHPSIYDLASGWSGGGYHHYRNPPSRPDHNGLDGLLQRQCHFRPGHRLRLRPISQHKCSSGDDRGYRTQWAHQPNYQPSTMASHHQRAAAKLVEIFWAVGPDSYGARRGAHKWNALDSVQDPILGCRHSRGTDHDDCSLSSIREPCCVILPPGFRLLLPDPGHGHNFALSGSHHYPLCLSHQQDYLIHDSHGDDDQC